MKYTRTLIFSFQSNEASVHDHFCTQSYIPIYSVELELHARSKLACAPMLGLTRIVWCHTPLPKEENRSLHTCAQDVQITHMANSKVNSSQCYNYNNIRVSLTKWPLGLKKDYRTNSITTIILSTAWMASTGEDRRRDLPNFLLPARTGHRSSIMWLHLWQWKASLSRLMVATQQVGEKMTWGLYAYEGLAMVWLAKSGGCILCLKDSTTKSKSSSPLDATLNIPQIPLQ
jgi:hypothetical protein